MRTFGKTTRPRRSLKKSWFSRSPKTYSNRTRQAPPRRIRHTTEPLILRRHSSSLYGPRIASQINYSKTIKRIVAPLLFAIWFGLLIYLPYFRVTKTVFYGLQLIKKETITDYLRNDILEARLPFLPGNNYFLLSTSRISKELEEKFSVSSIAVSKVFPNELHIELQEKISSLIYANKTQYFLLDQSGSSISFLGQETPTGFSTSTQNNVLQEQTSPATSTSSVAIMPEEQIAASSTLQSLIIPTATHSTPNYLKVRNLFGNLPLLVDNSSATTPTQGEALLPSTTIKGAIAFGEILEKGGVKTVKYFELQGDGGGLVVHITQPWVIYFQPTGNLEAQFANLKMILEQNAPKQYVDLRYGERVYWK